MKNQIELTGKRNGNRIEWQQHLAKHKDRYFPFVMTGRRVRSFIWLVTLVLITGVISLTGCMTSAERVDAAENNVLAAKNKLLYANAAYRVEFEAYRQEKTELIAGNDALIAAFELRIKAEENEDTRVNYNVLVAHLKRRNERINKQVDKYEVNGKRNFEKIINELNHDFDQPRKTRTVKVVN
jgi:hypothetical protein